MGLRRLEERVEAVKQSAPSRNAGRIKQYRQGDLYYFKIVNAKGQVKLQSAGLNSPKAVNAALQLLRDPATNLGDARLIGLLEVADAPSYDEAVSLLREPS